MKLEPLEILKRAITLDFRAAQRGDQKAIIRLTTSVTEFRSSIIKNRGSVSGISSGEIVGKQLISNLIWACEENNLAPPTELAQAVTDWLNLGRFSKVDRPNAKDVKPAPSWILARFFAENPDAGVREAQRYTKISTKTITKYRSDKYFNLEVETLRALIAGGVWDVKNL